ncbi:MAG: hypothetical protein WDM84_05150 [Bauldia sp.]
MTLVIDGAGFEVTTLRQDIETDGRHAIVRFGRDWDADARRRDFTVNALFADRAGVVHDPVGGYPDILARRIRFIGDPARRIEEDRLRILRFFRFHAQYGEGEIDAAGLSAAMRARDGLRELSAERIGQEMRRISIAPRAAETVATMQEAGVLPVVLGGIAYLAQFAAAVRFEAEAGAAAAVPPRLAALACRIEEGRAARLGTPAPRQCRARTDDGDAVRGCVGRRIARRPRHPPAALPARPGAFPRWASSMP